MSNKEGFKLGSWVSHQRDCCKDPARRAKLDKIGFNWSVLFLWDCNKIKHYIERNTSFLYIKSKQKLEACGKKKKWYVYLKCKHGHNTWKSLSELQRGSGCYICQNSPITKEEENIVLTNYPSKDREWFEKEMPNRTWNSIQLIASRNGVHKYNNWISYEEAKKLATSLNITSDKEWNEYSKSGQRPTNVPSNPRTVYIEWCGWPEFLGKNRKRKYIIENTILEYLKKAMSFVDRKTVCKDCNTTMTTLERKIRLLRAKGYNIINVRGKGYKLIED